VLGSATRIVRRTSSDPQRQMPIVGLSEKRLQRTPASADQINAITNTDVHPNRNKVAQGE